MQKRERKKKLFFLGWLIDATTAVLSTSRLVGVVMESGKPTAPKSFAPSMTTMMTLNPVEKHHTLTESDIAHEGHGEGQDAPADYNLGVINPIANIAVDNTKFALFSTALLGVSLYQSKPFR